VEPFRQQLHRMSEQLAGLSASQKMLAGSLIAIMVMTLVGWGQWAATPEMVPILDRTMSIEEISRIRSELVRAGISPRVVSNRVMVPAERHVEALAVLGEAQALPTNSVDAWNEIFKQSSLWEGPEKSGALLNRAKEMKLSQVLSASAFRGVQSAEVFINPVSERRIGGAGNREPSASIVITARPDAPVRHLVDAAALTVANAVSGLKVANVSVVVNTRTYRPRDSSRGDVFVGGDQYEDIQRLENRYIEKIRESIPFPNALVTVAVEINSRSGHETRETYDAKKSLQIPTFEEAETSQTHAAQRVMSAEPGAAANMPLSIEGWAGGAGGEITTTERNRTQLQVHPSKLIEHVNKPAGDHVVTRASVRLPLSHFVALYKRRHPAATSEPTDAELEPLILREMEAVRDHVVACCGMATSENVTVAPYDDLMPPMAAAVGEPSAAGSIRGLVWSHTKELAVAALAITSLFMASMMVRRSALATTISRPAGVQAAVPPATRQQVAGEMGDNIAMLDDMELDEDAMRDQQMVEQVSTMIKGNPDGAASLVKGWLNRS
jgi:flagellar biosynthesis/type III secretory pathway M-ring protein FliF/YscJ